MIDVMITYAQQESDFARRLYATLKKSDYQIWVDWEDIPLGANWWDAITQALENSGTVLFVVSPASMASPTCQLTLAHARHYNKRIISVLYQPATLEDALEHINDYEQPEAIEALMTQRDMPTLMSANWRFLQRREWLPMRPQHDNFVDGIDEIVSLLERDRSHIIMHTRLQQQAAEWERHEQAETHLLSAEHVLEAEVWLANGINKEPAPTSAHAAFIRASRQRLETLRVLNLRRTVGALVAVAVLSVALIGVSAWIYVQRGESAGVAALALAERDAATARVEALSAQSNRLNGLLLANYAQQAAEADNMPLALALAVQSVSYISNAQTRLSLSDIALEGGAITRLTPPQVANSLQVNAVAVSTDGSTAALALNDERVVLYDLPSRTIRAVFAGHDLPVTSLQFTPDGSAVYSASNVLLRFDTTTLESGNALTHGRSAFISTLDINAGGTRAATGALDGTVLLWNLNSDTSRTLAPAHEGAVNEVRFSADGSRIASVSDDDSAHIWDASNATLLKRYPLPADARTLGFSPDGTRFGVGSADGNVSIWSDDSDEPTHTLAHNSGIARLLFVDAERLLVATTDQRIYLWSLSDSQIQRVFRAHSALIKGMALHPDGRSFISGGLDGSAYWWRIDSDVQTQTYRIGGHTTPPHTAAYSPDGALLVSVDADARILMWDTTRGRVLRRYDYASGAHISAVNAVAFLPDGTQFLTGGADGRLLRWDAANADSVLQDYSAHSAPITALAVNADGTRALSGTDSGELFVWDFSSADSAHTPLTAENAPQGGIGTLALSSSGTLGVSAAGAQAALWDLQTGEIRHTFVHDAPILALAFSEDESRVYSGTTDGTLHVWDAISGARLEQVDVRSRATVSAVRFHVQSAQAFVGYEDGSAALWDLALASPNMQYSVFTPDVPIRWAAFRADGARVAVGTAAVMVAEVQSLSLEALLAWVAENRYVPELTCADRETYSIYPLCDAP